MQNASLRCDQRHTSKSFEPVRVAVPWGTDARSGELMKTPAENFGGGPIVIAEYNAAWPVMFEREREVVGEALGKLVVEIEHIGSTSIPGLPAKPIIDLLVGVRGLE